MASSPRFIHLIGLAGLAFAGVHVPHEAYGITQATKDGKTFFQRTVSEQEQLDKGLITVRRAGTDTCSGVLVTNAWVLTAGHCAIRERLTPAQVQVRLLPTGSANSQTVAVQAIYLFGGFSDEVGPDLALMHLAAPLRINGSTSGFRNRIWEGSRGDILGNKTAAFYGRGRDACTGGTSGTYQAADLTTASDTFQARAQPNNPLSPPTSTDFTSNPNGYFYRVLINKLQQIPRPGDSGGGAFMFRAGAPYLVGIHSGGDCTDGYQVNLIALKDWINAVFMSKWTPGTQSQPVYVYPGEVNGTRWGLQDVNTAHWAQAARAAAAMCYNRGFAGGHFDGHQGPLQPNPQNGFGLQCSGGDTAWFDIPAAVIAKTKWSFTNINTVTWAQAGRAAAELCSARGYVGGQFNGHMRNGQFGLFCYRGGAQWFDATDRQVADSKWDFPHVDKVNWAQAGRAAVGVCRAKGFSGGFFNGHQITGSGPKPGVRGIVCQK